ncbi:MAG TPA: pyruvate kinase [Candidatus Saccharimonadales bacterium]|jgi:pyruvate kinase|nr:pyruvate kinase [Candidatus Saccharimonadales bacterium]
MGTAKVYNGGKVKALRNEMHLTDQTPIVSLKSYKRTKIIATVGPATDSYEAIYKLIASGVNGIRCNFSHGTYEERDRQIPWVRKAAAELGKPVAIIQDLQGPKIRLGDFEGVIEIKTGDHLSFEYKTDYPHSGHIPIQYDLSAKVKPGERMYLFDGRIKMEITAVRDGVVYAKAQNSGAIIKRKGMNLPDTNFGGDILTKKDLEDIAYGAKQDFDYVATSFVQTAVDIENLRRILLEHNQHAKIIAKIETKAAVDNIEAIVKASDAIMVARGDLAVETLAESVPVVQRQIIGLGLKYAKPTIVATQMLISMTEMPEPTRAEVSDVATAVFVGADCVMLSDETANGKYPIEAVQVMKRVILYAERHAVLKAVFQLEREDNMQNAISSGIINLAENIHATAIVAETASGATAIQIAARRPETALIAVTDTPRTAQQLSLVYSVKSYVRPIDAQAAQKLTDWLQAKHVLETGDVVVTVSGRYPGRVGTTDTIKVRVLE